jgi:hypothetical protein
MIILLNIIVTIFSRSVTKPIIGPMSITDKISKGNFESH